MAEIVPFETGGDGWVTITRSDGRRVLMRPSKHEERCAICGMARVTHECRFEDEPERAPGLDLVAVRSDLACVMECLRQQWLTPPVKQAFDRLQTLAADVTALHLDYERLKKRCNSVDAYF